MILVAIVIALLVAVLASMPVKSLNQKWDEQDPNAGIPQERTDGEISLPRQESVSSKADAAGVHIERSQDS
ncbi:hypothetical protein VTN96DRAFT_148 [Rasamsonia emersonii]